MSPCASSEPHAGSQADPHWLQSPRDDPQSLGPLIYGSFEVFSTFPLFGPSKEWGLFGNQKQKQSVTWFSLSAGYLTSLQQAFQPLHFSQSRGIRYGSLKNRQKSTMDPHTQHVSL